MFIVTPDTPRLLIFCCLTTEYIMLMLENNKLVKERIIKKNIGVSVNRSKIHKDNDSINPIILEEIMRCHYLVVHILTT